eukprot:2746231-Rhodomonas_salina.4
MTYRMVPPGLPLARRPPWSSRLSMQQMPATDSETESTNAVEMGFAGSSSTTSPVGDSEYAAFFNVAKAIVGRNPRSSYTV